MNIYLSKENVRFEKQSEDFIKVYDIKDLDYTSGSMITVHMDKVYQDVHGFGASFTDTAAIAMSNVNKEEVEEAMVQFFDKEEGIGLSMIRNCIGGSDFTPVYYTYDDMPEGEEDWNLEHFDFSHDMKQIVPFTQWAKRINPDILLMLSPWTAPLWMKDKPCWKSKDHPILRKECYDVYSKYILKTIQSYEENGLPVDSMTVQNEPFAHLNWAGMYWDPEDLIEFTNNNMRPVLDEAGLKTKILNLDYNTCYFPRGNKIMEGTTDTTEGFAFHWYNGLADFMRISRDLFPDKLFYVSEASSDNPDTLPKLVHITRQIAKYLQNGAQCFVMWNIALDHNGGPTFENINTHCSGLISCNTETGHITYGKDFYALAHYSKFIQRGARVVYSTDTDLNNYQLINVVLKNPDGSMVAVITNSHAEDARTCKLVVENKVMEVTVPPNGVVTLHW